MPRQDPTARAQIPQILIVLLSMLVGMATAGRVCAQCTLAPLARLGGSITEVANLTGDRVAIFAGGTIEVLNAASSTFPRLGRVTTDHWPSAFSGGSNRVALGWQQTVLDNPTAAIEIYDTITNVPVLGSTITGFTRVEDLLVTYPYLHVAGPDGYAIYNISDPAAPVRLGGLSGVLVPNARCIAAAGLTAYIGSGQRLLVVDFSTPATPVIQGFRDLGATATIWDLAATGSLVLAATDDGLQCLEVSNPFNPTVRSVYQSFRAFYNVVARGTTVLARREFTGSLEVDLLDYTNSAAPTAVSTVLKNVSTITGPPTRVWCAEGEVQKVDALARGLTAYTITSPTVPTLYGSTTRGPTQPRELVVDADGLYAYTASGQVLSSIYIGAPGTPVLMNDAGLVLPTIPRGLTILGDTVVAAWNSGMSTIDVSQPLTPTIRDTGTFAGADGSAIAYSSSSFSRVVLGGNPIQVVDIADPANVSLYTSLAHAGKVQEVMSIPNRGFYAFTTSGGSIASIGINSAPLVLRDTLDDPTVEVQALAGSGTRLYAVLDGPSSAILRIISVLNPASLSVIRDVALPDTFGTFVADDIAILGDQLYISYFTYDGYRIVRFDIGIPDAPHLVETFQLGASASSLALTANAVITAEELRGLRIYSRPTSFTPYFTTDLTDNQTCWRGTFLAPNYAFTGAARGIPAPTYQWFQGSATTPIAGQTTTSLALGTPQMQTSTYRLVAGNTCGTATSTAMLHICIADFNCSGAISVQDIFDFLSTYFTGSLNADVNLSGALSVQDIFDFLAAYFTGC